MTRRALLASVSAAAAAKPEPAFLFRVRGTGGMFGGGDRTGFLRAGGTGFRVLDFGRPNQTGWGPYAFFRDGRRVLLLSIEMTPEWKTQPFHVFYPNSRTHLWIHDTVSETLTEIATKDRVAPFYQPAALLPSEDGLLITASIQGKEILHRIDLDGSHPRPLTKPGEYVYGIALSPDGRRVAFHADYRIVTMKLDGSDRIEVAGERGLLHFGPRWSPNGDWLCYQVCDSKNDPGHDWSDVWIARPDGRERRALTRGYEAWFAASYGKPDNPGSGSNMPAWSPDGREIVFNRRAPGSLPPWKYHVGRADTNHFNRDFLPLQARGGSQLAAISISSGAIRAITPAVEGRWDFRGEWSRDGRLLFCRAGIGENPAIWIVNRNGSAEKRLTDGVEGRGADHPRWLR